MIHASFYRRWRSIPLLLWLLAATLGAYAQSTALPAAGMQLWLKADALVKRNGASVSIWGDAGGSDRQALFTPLDDNSAAPIFVENVFNGKPAVRFAGNSLLRVNELALGPFTIAVVFSTTSGGEMLYQHGDSTHAFADGKGGCFLTTGINNTLAVKRLGVLTGKDATGAHPGAWAAYAGAPIVAITTFDGTDNGLRLYLNGVLQTLASPMAGGLDSRNIVSMPFDIGARAVNGDMQFHGDLAELVVYDYALPDMDRKLLNAALLKKYSSVPTFSDATRVNLLEQWSSNGTYALGCTGTAGDPTNAVGCAAAGEGWGITNSQSQPNDTVTARFSFPQPVVLGQVMVQWRAADHSPSNYLIRDQNGVIVLDTDGPYDDKPRVHTFAPRTSQYLEIACNPAATASNAFECMRLGAYLATGEVLSLTGATNILCEEDDKMAVTGNGYDPSWYGHTTSTAKPSAAGGNMTLHLSHDYELLGAFLSQQDTTRYLANARIEISRDGAHWTSVFYLEKYHFRGEAAPRDKGYLTWDVPKGTDLKASWVRLSWGANPDPVAITQFELFGRGASTVTEPARVNPPPAQRIITSTYGNPTRVNLLEQWNSNGTYALGCTSTAGDPMCAVSYAAGGTGWYLLNSQTQPNNTVTARFTFPKPVVLGQVLVQWRVASHSPSNYTFRDQNGVIVSDNNGPYDDKPRVHTFAPRSSEYLEITCNPAATAIDVFECDRLGAFLAKGQVLPLTGTTNILYEEDEKMTVTGNGYDPSWYGHTTSTAKPSADGGNMTLHLSREYELLGAFLSQYDTTRYLANARIEISKDGIHWTNVFYQDKYHFRGEPAPRDKGYLTWDVAPGADLRASWVRLSWGANTDPVEITQFQLFGR